MGVADRRTPQEGLASQLGEPSCDIPDPFSHAPGLRIVPYRRDFPGFPCDSGAAVAGFAHGVGDIVQKHATGEHPGELHLLWVDQGGDGVDAGSLSPSFDFVATDEDRVSACATKLHCEGVEQDPAGGEDDTLARHRSAQFPWPAPIRHDPRRASICCTCSSSTDSRDCAQRGSVP